MHMKMGVLCSVPEKSSEWTVSRQTSDYTQRWHGILLQIGFTKVMKLQVRLRQRHFWCLLFLLLLTHMFSAETVEEQPDDQWMKIRCNDTSPVQMVKVKFSSQVVRNGREYKLLCNIPCGFTFGSYHIIFILIPWILTGLQNPYRYGNSQHYINVTKLFA